LSVRAGYNDSEINFGGGVTLLGASIDYAYRMDAYMGGLHRFTVSYNFGLTLKEQKEERQKELKEQVKKIIAEELRKKETARAKEYFDSAFAFYKQEKYEDALDELDKAFEWNEEYKEAKQLKELTVKKLVGKYYDRGVAAFNDKNYISALENFKNVSGIEPDYKNTKQYINKLDEKMKMSGQAKQCFSQGVEYYVNRRYDDAVDIFTKALAADPGNDMIKQYMTKAKAQLSRASGGKKLSAGQAEEVKKLYFAGLKNYTAGDLKAALSSWKRALEINPEDIKILKSIEKAQAEQAELIKRGIK
jgi:tetratricopeptide (TPR) repeat protein